MATPLVARAPHCIACVRRMTSTHASALSPSFQQTRGKKKLAKVSTVNVELLQNIPGYGRRGSIIPATAGLVRNVWFPRKMAAYIPDTKLKELGIDANTVARDPTFQSVRQRKSARKAVKDSEKNPPTPAEGIEELVPMPLEVEPLTPDEAADVLERLAPPVLTVYRTPTVTTPSPPKSPSPSIPASSALSAAAAQAAANKKTKEKSEKTSIYGSVSTSDIAASLKAILAEDLAGARVGLMRENISFADQVEDMDRVRHLGRFEFDIRLKGASRAVRRTIDIQAQS